MTPRVLALSAGEHRIWVEQDGYRPAEETLELDLGGEASVSLSLEQILGRFRLTAATAAHVRLFDADSVVVFEGEAPVDAEIPPGTYQVEATAGHERWSEPVRVQAAGITEATAALVGPTGTATVTSNVTGALVALDGRERGFTPQVLTAIPVGDHQLRVIADGMRTYEGVLEIAEDEHAWLTVDLRQDRTSISPATWALGGIALALGIGAGIMTGFAADMHRRFTTARSLMQPARSIANESDALNLAADVLWLGAGLAAVTTLILLLATSDFGDEPSRASMTMGQP